MRTLLSRSEDRAWSRIVRTGPRSAAEHGVATQVAEERSGAFAEHDDAQPADRRPAPARDLVLRAARLERRRREQELEDLAQREIGLEGAAPGQHPREERGLPTARHLTAERGERRDDQPPLVEGPAEVAGGHVVARPGESERPAPG